MKIETSAPKVAEQQSHDEQLWNALQSTHLRLADQVEFSQQIQRGQVWVVVHPRNSPTVE
jgi:hypothetical protein